MLTGMAAAEKEDTREHDSVKLKSLYVSEKVILVMPVLYKTLKMMLSIIGPCFCAPSSSSLRV